MADAPAGSFAAQFLRGSTGDLFLLSYPGIDHGDAPRRALLVLPAFAEEMNKSRRQIALLGRALATDNVTTLVPDLHGTGDSDGDFGDASLLRWRSDVQAILDWVNTQGFASISILGLRAGALLAVDILANLDVRAEHLVLWQPIVSGKTMISQFLRLKAAASLTQETKGEGVRELRARLAAGEAVEVAGYWLSPALVEQFDALHLRDLNGASRVHWLQVQDGDHAPPAAKTVIEQQREQQIDVQFSGVTGEPFWSTAEISLAPELISATARALAPS